MGELVYSKMLETCAEAIIIRQPIRSCPPEGTRLWLPKEEPGKGGWMPMRCCIQCRLQAQSASAVASQEPQRSIAGDMDLVFDGHKCHEGVLPAVSACKYTC